MSEYAGARVFERAQGLSEAGCFTMDSVVDSGGIAVEKSSAWDLWEHGDINLSYDQMKNLPELIKRPPCESEKCVGALVPR
jgi:hypothetical protein